MNSSWQIKKFEDCLDQVVYTNKIQRKYFLASGLFPIVSQELKDINGYWNNEKDLFKCKKPVVIFGDHTKVLKYVDFDFVLGADGVKILKPIEIIDSKFFFYFLQSVDLQSLGYARHYRLLKKIDVSFPPLPEQQRIVKILDKVFEKTAKAKENAEKNLQNAKELFESYLQSVFENPGENWEEKRLNDICEFENGDRGTNYPSKAYQIKVGIPFINAGHLSHHGLDFTNMNSISRERFNLLNNGKIQKGDILFCLRGSLGKFCNVGKLNEGAIASSLVIVRPKESIINKFLMAYFESHICKSMIQKYRNGTAQPNLSAGSLRKFSIYLPPLTKQHQIIAKLNSLSTETNRLETPYKQKLADLEELKKSILKKAFNGEL